MLTAWFQHQKVSHGSGCICQHTTREENPILIDAERVDDRFMTRKVEDERALGTSLSFWDYKTGKPFQHLNDIPQSGSLDSEAVCSSV
jgi:hypothetical protein